MNHISTINFKRSNWVQTLVQRAALSHFVRTNQNQEKPPAIQQEWIKHFLEHSRLQSPSLQAKNVLRYFGDHLLETGLKLENIPIDFHAVIGSPTRDFAIEIATELVQRGLLTAIDGATISNNDLLEVGLTLSGWDMYEAEKKGKVSGKYGFIAMKFGDPILDPFVDETLKPSIMNELGHELVDLRNVSRAGVIDNIMRTQIRDSAFVLVDLTHDNSGAYWEAGYAEGLGKPVIYICEQKKFDEAKTHFDTNHCTTVCWDTSDTDSFIVSLIATLRRSLQKLPS